jgi:tetratricopeptide (TPR) repeat protein
MIVPRGAVMICNEVQSIRAAIEKYIIQYMTINIKGGENVKKVIIPLFIVLLLSTVSFGGCAGESDNSYLKVLVDETDIVEIGDNDQELFIEEFNFSRDTDWDYSFTNDDELWGYGTIRKKLEEFAAVDIKKSGSLSYNTLKHYDVLILASFTESYSSKESEAIKQFVENGGSLLLLAENEHANNSVSRVFDVTFSSETVYIADEDTGKSARKSISYPSRGIALVTVKMYFLTIDDMKNHSVTEDLEEFYLYETIPITSHKRGTVVAQTHANTFADEEGDGMGDKDEDEDEGPFDVVLAMDKVGKGRAVFISSSTSFWNLFTDKYEENVQLIANAVRWLGEPGGPYKQYKTVVEEAQQELSSATSLFNSHQFSQAMTAFEDAIDIFEESNTIFRNNDAVVGTEEAQSYIEKCETGLEANDIFDTAEDLYQQRKYEDAITEYENAKALYEEIEYSDRVTDCSQKIEESNQWIALREEATTELQKAEDSLSTAPSTFDPSGYEHSKSLFEEAKSTWEDYDDAEKEALCEEKIEFCEQEIANIEQTRMMVMVIVIIVVVAGVIVVILVIRKKKSKPAEMAEPPREVTEKAEEVEKPEKVEKVEKAKEPEKAEKAGETENASEVLKERYARGEISKEEYDRLKSVLEKD